MYRAELPLGPKLRWACACLAFIACVPASRPPADEPINAKCAMLTLPIKTISNAKMSSVFEHHCGDVAKLRAFWAPHLALDAPPPPHAPPSENDTSTLVVMLGDSTMKQQYETLVMMLGAEPLLDPASGRERIKSDGKLRFAGVELELYAAAARVAPRRDRLVLWNSAHTVCARDAVRGAPQYALYFWMHGVQTKPEDAP